jgi:hypothetical protein
MDSSWSCCLGGGGWCDDEVMEEKIYMMINVKMTSFRDCSVAQRKRVGLITQRSSDRNRVEQHFFA